MQDRRSDERFGAGLTVCLRWQADGTEVSAGGVAENISDGGAALAIRLTPMPPVGTELTVQVAASGAEAPPRLKARVVRHTATGLALVFV